MDKRILKGYQGIFFDEETQKKLIQLQENGLSDIVNDMHITFNFGELDQYPDELMNKEIVLKLIGYASDGKNSGFQVELPEELKSYYKNKNGAHITVSLGEVNGVKGKAVDTGIMKFEPINPVEISGKLGYFVFREDITKSGTVMDNNVFKENQTQYVDEKAEYEKLNRKIDELSSLKSNLYEIIEDFQKKVREDIKKGTIYRIISEEDKGKYNFIKDMMKIRVKTREERILQNIFGRVGGSNYDSPKKIDKLIEEHEIENEKSDDSALQQHFEELSESINEYKKHYNKYNNLNNEIADGINNMPMKDKKVTLIEQLDKNIGDISSINLDNEELKKYLMSEELCSDEIMREKKDQVDFNLSWVWDHIFIDDYDTAIKIAENLSEKGFTVEYGGKPLSEDLLNNPELLIELEQIGEAKAANWDEEIINRFKTVQIANIGKKLSEDKEFLMDMLSPFNLQVCKWASGKVANNREFGQKAINCYSEAFKLGDAIAFAEFNRKLDRNNSEDLEYLGLDEEGGYTEEEMQQKKQDRVKELKKLKEKYLLRSTNEVSKDKILADRIKESKNLDGKIGQAQELLTEFEKKDPEQKGKKVPEGEEQGNN